MPYCPKYPEEFLSVEQTTGFYSTSPFYSAGGVRPIGAVVNAEVELFSDR
jgi:hypothetical protein